MRCVVWCVVFFRVFRSSLVASLSCRGPAGLAAKGRSPRRTSNPEGVPRCLHDTTRTLIVTFEYDKQLVDAAVAIDWSQFLSTALVTFLECYDSVEVLRTRLIR